MKKNDKMEVVGYSISPNYREKRLMTEALETLVKWAYGFQDCKGITAKVLKTSKLRQAFTNTSGVFVFTLM
ncbi:GNAT family N-acetyltransferase [Clostridium sp. CF012]|uniref:GNAT family N-acetyltransferase n=1 Tax=Clostridium sp. CF012 TaxID=2843319 RepID=UPI0035CB9BA8